MPYPIKKQDGKSCVMEPDGEKVKKCYDNPTEAAAYQRALMAAENKGLPEPLPLEEKPAPLVIEGGKSRKWTQDESSYTPISPTLLEGRACITCRWYNPRGGYDYNESGCLIVDNWPKPITGMGVSNQYEPLPEYVYEPEPRPVYIVDAPDDDADEKGFKAEVSKLLRALTGGTKFKLEGDYGFKSKGNQWVAYWSNNARDEENELFPVVAIDNYIKGVRSGAFAYPELWLAHVPGTAHGRAKLIGRIDNVVYAIGEFDNSPFAKKIRAAYKRFPAWEVSHGFYYVDRLKLNGIYLWFKTYEISPLPAGLAANRITEFQEKGNAMGLDQTDIALLTAMGYDQTFINEISQNAAGKAAQIAAEGRETKSASGDALAALLGGQAAAPVATPVQPPAPAAPPVQPPSPVGEKGAGEWAAVVLQVQKAQQDRTDKLVLHLNEKVETLTANFNQLVGLLGLEVEPASQSAATQIPNVGGAAQLLNQGAQANGNGVDDFIMPWLKQPGT